MNKTNDFKYNLPAYSDPVDIEDLNDNFRGIDDALMAGLCKKDYTGNNMGSSDPSARKYAWAPWFEIVNDNEFDVVVTDRNAPVESEEATINIAAGQTFRKYINGRYYMNFYVQDQYDVTFKWFTNAETYINESGGGGGGTGTVTSVSVQGGSGSHLTGSGNPIETSGTITINVDDGYSIPSDNEQTAWDGKAADLKAEIDSSTYVLTLQLKDSAGNLIGTAKTIDLPLETMVVDGEYDSQTKKIKLELKNGNYVEFSVADLVSGLQTELSASNKLDPDYIDYNASHRAVSDTEKNTWNSKQNAISDLETIRSGAAAGATAVQPSAMQTALATKQDSLSETQLAAVNSGINSTKVAQIETNKTNILYGLNMGVKNLVPIHFIRETAGSSHGITVTEIGNAVRFAGTAGSSTSYAAYIASQIPFKAGTYVISGMSGGSDNTYRIRIGTGSGDVFLANFTSGNTQFTLSSDTTISLQFVCANGVTVDVTTQLMICTLDAWNQSHDYQPYALPNYDLTRLESEDRASLAEVVDSGAKNLLDEWTEVAKRYGATGNTIERNGITYTYSNGSITISGTATANENFFLLQDTMLLSNGNYVVAWRSKTINAISTNVAYRNASTNITSTDSVIELPKRTDSASLWLYIPNGTTVSGTIDIMICTKAAFGVSSKFVPYRPNYDLVCNTLASVTKITQTVNVSYTLISNLTYTSTPNTIARIAVIAMNSGKVPTGIIISRSNQASQFENASNLIAKSEASYDCRQLQTDAIVTDGSATTYYIWAKVSEANSTMVKLVTQIIGYTS